MVDTKPSDMLIVTIIVIIGVIGIVTLVTNANSINPSILNDTNVVSGNNFTEFSLLDKSNEINSSVNNIKSSVQQVGSGTLFGFLDGLYGTVYYTVTSLFQSMNFMGKMVGISGEILEIPSGIIMLFGLLIIIVIAFALISGVFQRDL